MKTRNSSYQLPSVTLLMQNCVICVDSALCARRLRDAKLCYKNANAGIVTDSASGEQEPSGPGHRTHNTTHGAGTPVNGSQVAQGGAHAKQRSERAHRETGARWPRTPHMQHITPGEHTGEQEPSGPGQGTHNITHLAGKPVIGSQAAPDTAHSTQQTTRAHR